MRRSQPWRASPPPALLAQPEPAGTPESSTGQDRPSVSYDLPVRVHTMHRCHRIRAKIAQIVVHFATTQSGSVHQCRKNHAYVAHFCVHRYVLVSLVPAALFRLTRPAARGRLSARPWSFSHPCPPEPVPSARTAAGPSRPAESGRLSRHGSRSSVSFPTFDCVNRRARRGVCPTRKRSPEVSP